MDKSESEERPGTSEREEVEMGAGLVEQVSLGASSRLGVGCGVAIVNPFKSANKPSKWTHMHVLSSRYTFANHEP